LTFWEEISAALKKIVPHGEKPAGAAGVRTPEEWIPESAAPAVRQ